MSHDPPETAPLDPEHYRPDFPQLNEKYRGRTIAYLDNAATTQKPACVLDALQRYYRRSNSNIHRGVHILSQRATDAYEAARVKVQRFINAEHAHEVIFVRGTTEALNLVAATHGRQQVREGDNIVVTTMEHHSNIVPWQVVAEQAGASLRVVPVTDAGELDLSAFDDLLDARTKIVACAHVSNALGTVNPVRLIAQRAHSAGAVVVVDGAQSVAHLPVDVQSLGADFYAFSGHKLFGPTGIGVLYGRSELLDSMPPYETGGGMISTVSFEGTTYAPLPGKFEAGTPHIAGAIGLGAAVDYVTSVGLGRLGAWEAELLDYATERCADVRGFRVVGTAADKASVLSFVMDSAHPHDIGTILDHGGVAVRAGHHCAMPLMRRFGIPATARASCAFYNTRDEVEALVAGLNEVNRMLGSP